MGYLLLPAEFLEGWMKGMCRGCDANLSRASCEWLSDPVDIGVMITGHLHPKDAAHW